MNKITTAALAATLLALPVIPSAKADSVFLGGTGSPQNRDMTWQEIDGFITPFVDDTDTEVVRVRYPAGVLDVPQKSAPLVVQGVDKAAAADPGKPVTVVAVSKGAQAARAGEKIDTRPDTHYVLIGDPDNPRGMSRAFGISPPIGEVKHNVDVVYGQYDGFAHFPDRPNPIAIANALVGIPYVHVPLGQGGEDDALTRLDEAEVTVKDNRDADGKPNGTKTTTRVVPTKRLPLARAYADTMRTFRLPGADETEKTLDRVLRPVADSGYSKKPNPKPKKADTSDTSNTKKAAADSDS